MSVKCYLDAHLWPTSSEHAVNMPAARVTRPMSRRFFIVFFM